MMTMDEAGKGTLIEEITVIAASGSFCTPEIPPPGEGEEVIGECTDLEKAVFSLFDNKAAEIMTLKKSLKDDCEEHAKAKFERLQMLRSQIQTLKDIFWQLIKDRLGKHKHNLVIREGFKVVEISDEAAAKLADPQPNVRIIGIGGLDGLAALLSRR